MPKPLGNAITCKLPTNWETPQPESGWRRKPELAASLAVCKESTREHATSFFFASFPLPAEKKSAAYAIYAFCRWVDDVIDETPPDQQPDLATLQAELDSILAGESKLPFAPAFAEVTRQYAVPISFYVDLMEGCCWDRKPVEFVDFAELELYCYHVASVVGLIMSRIFGLKELAGVPRAIEMGIAMQLTNILRDVAEDFTRNRIYLPREELAEFGLNRDFLSTPNAADPRWRKFTRFQIDRARDYYCSGEIGLPYLDADGSRFCVRLMSRVYGGILGAIERKQSDVFSGRCYVPTRRKLVIAMGAAAAALH
ncbi:phytoene/squalene synthase family protein [Cerasicoccus arenae]|uniref:Phytoene desaturase n=1 Tax=Cerasicoccus arenae TaxID=424488 RepID=A0A8J3GDW6_9BACT|nr:phytoene/squalene synthase family protein [Cerasicoccus arenae]MBK1856680.1 phytoene/squalene synthase family protein [Cerasicoccus arenae]GHB98872.1 phytoene desaturase [Cerasicoccus arenae]